MQTFKLSRAMKTVLLDLLRQERARAGERVTWYNLPESTTQTTRDELVACDLIRVVKQVHMREVSHCAVLTETGRAVAQDIVIDLNGAG